MESEIREYEEQLAEVRSALEQESSEELQELEVELVGLIDELKRKLPRFPTGSSVTVNGDQLASVISVDGTYPNYFYTLKFRNEIDVSDGSVPESSLSLAAEPPVSKPKDSNSPLPLPEAKMPAGSETVKTSPKTKAETTQVVERMNKSSPMPKVETRVPKAKVETTRAPKTQIDRAASETKSPPVDNTFEESRSKWQSFTKNKGKKPGALRTAPKGVTKKPPPKRPHFASK